MVRDVLRRLAGLPDPIEEAQYREVLRDLMVRSAALYENLFEPVDGDAAAAAEVRELMRSVGCEAGTTHPPSLEIILCDETVHVPWGFTYKCEMPDPPASVHRSIADLSDF
jgi:hypothetical protein